MNIRDGWNCKYIISVDVSLLPAMLRQASSAQKDRYTKRERVINRERERVTVNVNGNVALGFRNNDLDQSDCSMYSRDQYSTPARTHTVTDTLAPTLSSRVYHGQWTRTRTVDTDKNRRVATDGDWPGRVL